MAITIQRIRQIAIFFCLLLANSTLAETGISAVFKQDFPVETTNSTVVKLAKSTSTQKRPNIIILIADDLNDSIEGMGGHPQARTPHIKALASQGVRFTNAACSVPLCGPSRASLWSGLSPLTTGFYGYQQQRNHWNHNPVIAQSKSLFEHFVKNGYLNYSTGKIHHNGHEVMGIFKNSDGSSGFGHEGNFGPIPWDGRQATMQNGVIPPWMPEGLQQSGNWGDGFGPIQDLSAYGDEFSWKWFYQDRPWQYREGDNRDLMPDEICTADAVAFLQKSHQKPFLLTVGFSRPHTPLYVPQEYFDRFPLESLELAQRLKGDKNDVAKILAQDHDIAQPWGWPKYQSVIKNGGKAQLLKWTQAYLACVAFVDEQVGQILKVLENSEYAENTIVILTSDHGYHMGEKDYLFKFSPWEESARVPLIVAGPGIAAGKSTATPVSLLDIYPTLLDAASIPCPSASGQKYPLDGFSMMPLLKNPEHGEWEGPDFTLTAIASKMPVEPDSVAPVEAQHFSLRDRTFRFIYCRNGEIELYDHSQDPFEWNNLVHDRAYQSVVDMMKARLRDLKIL